jgi:plastocyanin
MRVSLLSGTAFALGGALFMWSCGGGSSSPAAPTTPAPATSAPTVTVTIASATGPSSFAPNPVPATAGDTVAFKNNDTANTHHIVMDDGSADLGNLAPGQTSQTITVKGSGNFHCATHPWMVGAINQAVPDAPPCTAGPGYCG